MCKCSNCGTEILSKYCPACGQEITVKRLEVKSIIHDVTHGILHWENSILKTFKKLLSDPGNTARHYISGARKSYIKPFSYFIFIQTVYVLIFHRLSEKFFAFMSMTVNSPDSLHSGVVKYQQLVNSYINYLNYFMPVFFALYFLLFFRKKTGINYAESIAAAFYWTGTTLVFGIALMLLSLIEVRIWNARFIINIIFFVFAAVQFTGELKAVIILKSIAATLLSYITFILFVGLIMVIYFLITSGSVSVH